MTGPPADASAAPPAPADAARPADAPPEYRGDLRQGLVVYLRLDDGPGSPVVKDGSGRGAIASLRSIDIDNAWQDGRFVRALALDGASWSGWIEVASNDAINELSDRVTLSLWVWRTGSGGTLISRRHVGPRGFIYELGLSGDTLFARLNTAAAYTVRVTGIAIPAGRWVHVAMTFDVKDLRLYADGRLVGASPFLQALPPELSSVVVGGAQQQDGTIGSRFAGRIDDVALYARALSAADVAALAAGVQPPSR
jgi:hypothetical protein